MEYYKLKVHTSFKGSVGVKSFEVQEAIKQGKGIRIYSEIDDRAMLYSKEEVVNSFQWDTPKIYNCQFKPGRKYTLYMFPVRASIVEDKSPKLTAEINLSMPEVEHLLHVAQTAVADKTSINVFEMPVHASLGDESRLLMVKINVSEK